MSFILDALRKSEHERQRSATPGLSLVPLAAPRRELPGWAMLVIGVLAAAVLVLGGAWWQSQRSLSSSTAAQTVAPQAASAPATVSPTPAATPAVAAPIATPPPAAVTEPPAPQPAVVVASTASPQDLKSAAGIDDRTQSLASAALVPKRPAPIGPTLPSAAALQAQGVSVPPLRLELHGYSDKPAERFVFINGHKYKEGERLAEGLDVVAVEPNGVVLSQQGQRFLLTPE